MSAAREIHLTIPLSEGDVRALSLGDHVYLTGTFFTGRSRFHQWSIEKGCAPAIDFSQVNVIMHIGPVMQREEQRWVAVSLDQTSSFRFEKWTPQAIHRFQLRAIVGKTTMGESAATAMREHGCVHLTRVGTPGNLLAQKVKRVLDVFNLDDFGMTEATWVIEAEDLGPFIVDIDAAGRNLFDDVRRATDAKMSEIYRRFGIADEVAEHAVS